MFNLENLEKICEVGFIRVSGPGGQHKNKRETGVRLYHPDSGVTVTATERRSQHQNKTNAYDRMREKLLKLNGEENKEPRIMMEKPKDLDEVRLKDKHYNSKIKTMRRQGWDE